MLHLIELSTAIIGCILGVYNFFDMLKLHHDTKKIKGDLLLNIEINKDRHNEIRDKFDKHIDLYYSRHEELRNILKELSKDMKDGQQAVILTTTAVNGNLKKVA